MSISLKNLTKKFDGRTVIDNFSYEFDEKGIVAISGASGAGKTTLLRIILGLEKKMSGERIVKNGTKFSVSFQEHRLLPHLSALENIVTLAFDSPSEEDVNRSREMLRHFGFSDEEMMLFPAQLSGGMKQRASLVRAFLHECNVLILDEPTKELDSELVRAVLDYVKLLSETKLVIIVSHSADDIEYLGAEVISL